MIKTFIVVCLVALAAAQHNNQHPPHHPDPHPHPTTDCNGDADCDAADCPDSTMDAFCAIIDHGANQCYCHVASPIVRAQDPACMNDSDCTCHNDEVAMCEINADPTHNHCRCHKQQCTVDADCTITCDHNHVAACHVHHDPTHNECKCQHQARRQAATACTVDGDCTNTCHHGQVASCHVHNDPTHNNCGCKHPTCATTADCSMVTCGDNQVASCHVNHHDASQSHCRCQHQARRQAATACTADSDCNNTCDAGLVASCHVHHDPTHNNCGCKHRTCATTADCSMVTCAANQVPNCHVNHHDASHNNCRCQDQARRQAADECLTNADCHGHNCHNGGQHYCDTTADPNECACHHHHNG